MKDMESLREAAEGASPELVEAARDFLLAAGDDEMGQALAARALGWLAGGVGSLEPEQVTSALVAPSGYEAVLPLMEARMLGEADPLARAKLRGVERKGELLEAEGGAAGTGEVSEVLGITPQAVDKRRERGTILALPTGGGRYAFPRWQFDERGKDGLIPGFAAALKNFSVESPWMRAEFMLAPNGRLGGKRPLDALREGEEVMEAVAAYGRHGAA